MNMLKAPAVALLLLGTSTVFAETSVVEIYNYDTHLDIAKVISQDVIPEVCGIVAVKIRYLDHDQHEHLMQYLVQGTGCNNN